MAGLFAYLLIIGGFTGLAIGLFFAFRSIKLI
jgi:hypothetical protein